MRAIFLGKKPAGAECLRYLVKRGVEIAWDERIISGYMVY